MERSGQALKLMPDDGMNTWTFMWQNFYSYPSLCFNYANKWTEVDLWKRPFRVTTFQRSSPNGARWRLIETNGVLFAVLKGRVLQKRHRPPPDKTSRLSFDTAMYPHEYTNLHGNSRWANKMNKKREKLYIYSQTSRLENPEELQQRHNHEKFTFLTVLLLFAQCKMYYWWLVTWLDLTLK
jgi:hypothetical protein